MAHSDEDVQVLVELLRGTRVEDETRASPGSLNGVQPVVPKRLMQHVSRQVFESD